MKISARNVLAGTVKSVTKGAINAEVTLALGGGETVVAVITNSSADLLGLEPGKSAYAVVKASEVMIGVGVARLNYKCPQRAPGRSCQCPAGRCQQRS